MVSFNSLIILDMFYVVLKKVDSCLDADYYSSLKF